MKNITQEQAKRIAVFFAIASGVCTLFILLSFIFFFNMLSQFYFLLYSSILAILDGLILIVAVIFWVHFLKLRKNSRI